MHTQCLYKGRSFAQWLAANARRIEKAWEWQKVTKSDQNVD
jgi:hypothetical protein